MFTIEAHLLQKEQNIQRQCGVWERPLDNYVSWTFQFQNSKRNVTRGFVGFPWVLRLR